MPTSANPPPKYQSVDFVNLTGSNGHMSKEARMVVRSRAATRGWAALGGESRPRRMRKRRVKGQPAQLPVIDLDQAKDHPRSQHWSEVERLGLLAARIGKMGDIEELAQSKFDPFNTLPVPHDLFVNMLLFNCVSDPAQFPVMTK